MSLGPLYWKCPDGGTRTIASLFPLLWKHAGIYLPDYIGDLPHKVHEDAGAPRDATVVLSDERSKAELLAQVRLRGLRADFLPSSLGAPSRVAWC